MDDIIERLEACLNAPEGSPTEDETEKAIREAIGEIKRLRQLLKEDSDEGDIDMETIQKPDLSALRKELPPFLSRKHPRFAEWVGYSPRSLANMDCLGQTAGIKRIMLGNTVAYERESLIMWLENRSRIIR